MQSLKLPIMHLYANSVFYIRDTMHSGLAGWVLSSVPKGWEFDSQSGLWAYSPVGNVQDAGGNG